MHGTVLSSHLHDHHNTQMNTCAAFSRLPIVRKDLSISSSSSETLSLCTQKSKVIHKSTFLNTSEVDSPNDLYAKTSSASEKLKKVTFKEGSESYPEDPAYVEDLRRGERLANIPFTFSERQQTLLLEASVKKALQLWPNETDKDDVLESSMLKFQNAEEIGDSVSRSTASSPLKSDDFERGTYRGVCVLPWMAELKRRFPRQVLLRSLKLALRNKSATKECIEDADGESVPLFLVHWGLVQDPLASKRRQKEKQDEEKWQEKTHEAYSHQVQAESVYNEKLQGSTTAVQPRPSLTKKPSSTLSTNHDSDSQRRRPIIKTSHLKGSCQMTYNESYTINSNVNQRRSSGESSSGISSYDSCSPRPSPTLGVEDLFFSTSALANYVHSKAQMTDSEF